MRRGPLQGSMVVVGGVPTDMSRDFDRDPLTATKSSLTIDTVRGPLPRLIRHLHMAVLHEGVEAEIVPNPSRAPTVRTTLRRPLC